MKPMVVAVVGPTGVGKSDLGIDLAKTLGARGVAAEIVNADAMQLYSGLDVGSAKVPVSGRQGVSHHLLDIWPVSKEASVADYQRLARDTVRDCFSRGVVPILVGGSGLYVSSVLYDFDFPGTNREIRRGLEHRLQSEGVDVLVRELAEKDPEAAEAIDPRNSRRIVRALEVIAITGQPFGAGLQARSRLYVDPTRVVGLRMDRATLSEALEKRVMRMWEGGLVEEGRALLAGSEEIGVTARQAIGYRQVMAFLEGQMTEDDAIAETVSLTKRYARRQMSWFRRDPHVDWWDVDEEGARKRLVDDVVAWVSQHLAN